MATSRTSPGPGQHPKVDKNAKPHPGVKRVRSNPEAGGRPALVIDHDQLYAAAETMASFDHLGVIFGCAGENLKRNPEFREIVEKARAAKKQTLLAAQFQTAINDRNPTMQIWLGKQYLEQKDVQRTEHSGPDGKPIESRHTKRVIAVFPDNGRRRQTAEERANAHIPA